MCKEQVKNLLLKIQEGLLLFKDKKIQLLLLKW